MRRGRELSGTTKNHPGWARSALAIGAIALVPLAAACSKSDSSSTTGTTQSPGTTQAPGTTVAKGKGTSGLSTDEIKKAQAQLNTVGCGAGPVDGIDGGETTDAIIDFQASSGLPTTGTLDPATTSALSSAASANKQVCVATTTTSTSTSAPASSSSSSSTSQASTTTTNINNQIGASQAAMEQTASRYYTSLGWDKCSPPIQAGPVVDVDSQASSFTAYKGGYGISTSTWNSQQLPWNASWNGSVWIVSFTAAPGNCPINVMGAG
ncbi:MAG: peptidoglycan-binding domain-containing protein [Acidimicrobiales bacterium]